MVNGPTVSPAPELSSGVKGVMGNGSGHEGVIGRVREEVEKPNRKPRKCQHRELQGARPSLVSGREGKGGYVLASSRTSI